ncbi:MAG TPA: DUF885 domain-containing protein [Pyrinomonadaceae bacterium]|jgi:hypothetical protein|nr:DUF885 domain-containing protein [Pyrinomonadaceae bacterium]
MLARKFFVLGLALSFVTALPLSLSTTGAHFADGESSQVSGTATPTAQLPAWVVRSNENTQVLLAVLARFGPEGAAQLGVNGYDEQIIDLKPKINERAIQATREAIQVLKGRLATEKDPLVRQDLEILIKSAEDNIRGNELNDKYEIPYFNMSRLFFFGMRGLLDDQVPAERRKAALVRLRRYAGMETGYEPLTALAEARTRERLSKPGLIGPPKAQVEKDLANADFFINGIGQLFDKYKVEGYQEAYARLKEQLAAYNEFVRKEIMPKARTDFRLPAEEYAYALEQYGVDIPPAQLAAKAHAAFNELQKEMQELAPRVAREKGITATDYREVIRALKKDQLVGETILPFYEKRIKEIEEIIRREHLVTLPARPVRIRLASEAESAAVPAPNMRPPRLLGNTGEIGEFVLPLRVPSNKPGAELQQFDDFTFAASSWTLSAHEARPGHELQFASIIEKGVSSARAIFAFNSTNVEGWGLYAEAILKPYMPLDGQLISLQHRMMRAARAFLDPELQMGKVTPEEALRVLKEDVVLSDAMANQEVERYTFRTPGQATSYFYGYTRLMELRAEAQKLMGKQFDQQKYHDFILAQGLLPPDLLRKAVLEQIRANKLTD